MRWKAARRSSWSTAASAISNAAMENTPYQFYADHIANGAMVFGAFRKDWQSFDFSKTRVSMKQGGRTIIEKTGGHPTGNPAKPAVVLANLRRGTTGLRAGISS